MTNISFAGRSLYNLKQPRLPEQFEASQSPGRDAPLKIIALRVEFVPDTLETTTGDGTFAYDRDHSLYASFDDTTTIYYDPFPHDSLYFADHLEFLRFYYRTMSNNTLDMSFDIYPVGREAAYRLPKQMWQYNWNYTDAQLDKGLAELFRDAIVAADNDSQIVWQNYDLVIIFHAGAGKEFELGYRMTPHDVPSAWMVPEDFRSQLNLPSGIPVDDGAYHITSGLILPETESHDGVQIGMAGVICLLFGHWYGLPALYDRDDGKPVVGKWSMMDRGFGNFYGVLPGPIDAWSANYMGWLPVTEIDPGAHSIRSRFSSDPIPIPQALRIPITATEGFLLECRNRDPENDSIAIAYDREGRWMQFNEDYSVTFEPGFRVPVRVDNLDFDSPGSGILIWHYDNNLRSQIPSGRFNSSNNLRGLDLEEADGAQDIGREYPFLTPGYGTDYGIFEDAWYGDNRAHRDANGGRAVAFNNNSFPNSRSNSEAFTNIAVDSLSRRADIMGFRYRNTDKLFEIRLPEGMQYRKLIVGNFDDNPLTDEFLTFDRDSIRIFLRDGSHLASINLGANNSVDSHVSRDINGDGRDDVIWTAYNGLFALTSQPNNEWLITTVSPIGGFGSHLALGGTVDNNIIVDIKSTNEGLVNCNRYDTDLSIINSFTLDTERENCGSVVSLHRFGTASSDSFLIVTNKTAVYLWTTDALSQLIAPLPSAPERGFADMYSPMVADFDADGVQDIIIWTSQGVSNNRAEHFRISVSGLSSGNPVRTVIQTDYRYYPHFPFDLNRDGRFEVYGVKPGPFNTVFDGRSDQILALYPDGLYVEGYPQTYLGNEALPRTYASPKKCLLLDNSEYLMFHQVSLNQSNPMQPVQPGSPKYKLDAKLRNGASLHGFPLIIPGGVSVHFAELDTVPGYDILIVSDSVITAWTLPTSQWRNQQIWNQNNDNANAVWESAQSFAPPVGAAIMPDDLCYNWPNPARESTAIRYFLNFPSTVKITIYDIAGDKVITLSGPGSAGVPNEVMWNLSNVARGGYLAVVEASANGKTERKTVKIAVVK